MVTVQTLSLASLWEACRAKIIRGKFAQDVAVLTVANLIGAALSFVQGILVARWLGPELYGIAALVMIYPNFVYTFFNTRSAEASVKYLGEFHARNERDCVLAMYKLGYAVDFVFAAVAFFVVLVTAPRAAQALVHHPEAAGLIVVYAITFIPHALVGTSYATLATLRRFSLISLIDILTTSVRVTLVLALVGGGWQVTGVIWGNALAIMARGLLYGSIAWVLRRRTWGAFPPGGSWQALKGRRREIFGFLAYNDLNTLLGIIPKQLDVLLLGYFRSPMEVGYYKLAKNLAGGVGYLVGPLQSVTYPELVRLSGLDDKQALRQMARRLALQVGTPLGFAVLGAVLLMPFILPTMLGPAFTPAVTAAQLLLAGSAIWLTFFWVRPLYMARGNIRQWLTISTLVASLTVVAYLVIVPYWGYLGLSSWSVAMQLFSHGIAVFWFLRGSLEP